MDHRQQAFALRRAPPRAALRWGRAPSIIQPHRSESANRDSDCLYRFDSYFYYLSAFPEPEAVLGLIAGEEPRSILSAASATGARALGGLRNGPEGCKAAFGFDEAYPVESLDEHIAEAARRSACALLRPGPTRLGRAHHGMAESSPRAGTHGRHRACRNPRPCAPCSTTCA